MRFSTFDPRYSLRARIALVVASLTLTLALVLTAITGQITGRQLDASVGQTLSQLSSSVVGEVARTLFERRREIQIVATQDMLLAANDSTTSIRTLLNQMKQTYRFYSWIGWVSPTGTVLASTDGVLEGQNVSSQSWFQQAPLAQNPYMSSIQENPQLTTLLPTSDNQPQRFVDIAMPVRSADGSLLGILGASVDWRFIREQSSGVEQQFAKQSGLSSNAGQIEVFVVAADGTVLIGPPEFSSDSTAQLPKLSLQSINAANAGQAGYLSEVWPDSNYTYLTGYAKDTGYRNFAGMGWVILIRERADIALAGVTQLQFVILAIGILCAILFSAIGWLLAIQVTRPLVHIVELARDLKTGDAHDLTPARMEHADEVAILSNTIDRLLVSLNTRNTQLTEFNNTLERRIDERTRELSRSQRLNEKIVSTVPDVVYIFDLAQARNIYINQVVGSLIGYEVQTLLEANDQQLDIIHPDDLKTYRETKAQVCEAADGVHIEQTYRLKHRDGHWVWVHCRETVFSRDAEGKATQILGVAQDITLRKQAEERLQEAVVAQERQRLARELHDSVSQTLFFGSDDRSDLAAVVG